MDPKTPDVRQFRLKCFEVILKFDKIFLEILKNV